MYISQYDQPNIACPAFKYRVWANIRFEKHVLWLFVVLLGKD